MDGRVAQRGVVHRRDVPGPHEAGVREHRERRVREIARRAARSTCSRRVTGRSSTLLRPRISRIGTMSSSRMCWTMCITSSWSPSPSIGETSAARIAAARRRTAPGGRSPGLCGEPVARPRRQASRYRIASAATPISTLGSKRPGDLWERRSMPSLGIVTRSTKSGAGLTSVSHRSTLPIRRSVDADRGQGPQPARLRRHRESTSSSAFARCHARSRSWLSSRSSCSRSAIRRSPTRRWPRPRLHLKGVTLRARDASREMMHSINLVQRRARRSRSSATATSAGAGARRAPPATPGGDVSTAA